MVRRKWFEKKPSKVSSNRHGKAQNKPQFYRENTKITITDDFEVLGVTIDDKLKFEKHVAKVCRKVSRQVEVLKRMKKLLPFETRKSIYFAFILPHFNYCSETWPFSSKSASAKLEKVNERALRFVFNEKQTQYQELLNKIGLPSLTNQRLAKIVCMVYKAINHDHAPKSIKSY